MSVATRARRLAAPIGRPLRRAAVGLRTRDWPAHSRLFVEQEAAEWVLSYEARQLVRTAEALGVELGPPGWARGVANQAIFHLSQFTLLQHDFERDGNNLGLSYFHGRPGTPGMPEFDACFDTLRARHREIDRVQVTNREMEGLVRSTGIAAGEGAHDPDRHRHRRLPPARRQVTRCCARARLGLPGSAFVVGSFQKDGVGWGEGLEPKLIKGPDVLLAVAERLAETLPELHFLLTGPARGYVRSGLERLGIPYRHLLLPDVDAVAEMYPAIDVCLVASRDEGGPRAVLESMATRVPLVTTRVGQAADLVRNGENGWMVEPEDVQGLVDAIGRIAAAGDRELDRVLDAGRRVAEENSYVALRPRWRDLLEGFVALPAS